MEATLKYIDLRSDTVTKPTPEMREAIANAEVGDDVFAEDPTMNELQNNTAELLGKEAALFVPSGTMSNQIAIKCNTQPGDEVICEINCHSFNYEGGGPALLSGVQIHPLLGVRGVITAEQVESAIRPPDHHYAQSRLIVLENTHNRAGGALFPLETIQEVHAVAEKHNLRMHLDGARLWNASVASGISEKEYARYFDSISVCLSKGLGAPVGSLVVGSAELIDQAHRYRKIFGGGMRQVGLLAAAGIYALDNHRARLAEDHTRARRLGEALAALPGVSVDLLALQTNIVIADFKDAKKPATEIVEKGRGEGILFLAFGPTKIRLVTHLDVNDDDIDTSIEFFNKFFRN